MEAAVVASTFRHQLTPLPYGRLITNPSAVGKAITGLAYGRPERLPKWRTTAIGTPRRPPNRSTHGLTARARARIGPISRWGRLGSETDLPDATSVIEVRATAKPARGDPTQYWPRVVSAGVPWRASSRAPGARL